MPQPEREARCLNDSPPPGDASAMARWYASVAQLFDVPSAHVFFAAGAEVADVRRVTVQVRDRLKRDWAGRWLVVVWVGTDEDGPPAGAQVVTWVTGTVVQTVTANKTYLVLTDADGAASLDIEVTGAGTRYAVGTVIGPMRGKALTWV